MKSSQVPSRDGSDRHRKWGHAQYPLAYKDVYLDFSHSL